MFEFVIGLLKITFESKERNQLQKTYEEKLKSVQKKIIEFFKTKSETIMNIGLQNLFQDVLVILFRFTKISFRGRKRPVDPLQVIKIDRISSRQLLSKSLIKVDIKGIREIPLQGPIQKHHLKNS